MIPSQNSFQGNSHQDREEHLLVQTEMFHVEKQIEHDGVEMGVLGNGVPYLSERGLARLCGINRTVLNRLAVNWSEEKTKDRGSAINDILVSRDYRHPSLFLRSELNGVVVNAYTEPVCMALLEYYAFIAEEKRSEAVKVCRQLALFSFRAFVYRAVGYTPEQKQLESWKHFHDRIDMTQSAVPLGYFSVFREIAQMIVPMIRAGVIISDRVVPDISVGKAWSKHWLENNLALRHGERIRYDHDYPEYYPQAKSNPQPSFAYPDAALGEFRSWLRKSYITSSLPDYISRQFKAGKIPQVSAGKVLSAFSLPLNLPSGRPKGTLG
jgi:hypothetical protein